MSRPSSAFSNMHKIKPLRFANVEVRRKNDSNRLKIERQDRRTRNFNLKRNISEEDVTAVEATKENNCYQKIEANIVDRKIALKKFIAEKNALKQALKKKERPPFKVGIPHHGSSPILKQSSDNSCKRITRANKRAADEKSDGGFLQKRGPHACKHPNSPAQNFPFYEFKSVFHFQGNKLGSVKKLTSPHTPTVLKRSAKKNPTHFKNITNHKVLRSKSSKQSTLSCDSVESLAVPLPQRESSTSDNEGKESSGVEKSAVKEGLPEATNVSDGEEERITEPKQEICSPVTIAGVELRSNLRKSTPLKSLSSSESKKSPHVSVVEVKLGQIKKPLAVSSPGKDKITDVLDLPKIDESHVKGNSLAMQKTEPSDDYTFQCARLAAETNRLLDLTEEWENIALQENVPVDVVDEIDSVVGNTKLLTNDKFKQFSGLIEEFENHGEGPKITCEDLNGFWDMIYLQVEQLNKKFEDLKSLKNNNWEKPKPTTKRKRRPIKKSNLDNVPSPSNADESYMRNTKLAILGESVQGEGKNDSMKTLMSSDRKRTRSYSPSPYISMRLSNVGRSMGRSSIAIEAMDDVSTPTSILRKKVKVEFQEHVNESDLLSTAPADSECQEEALMKTPRRISLRLRGRSPTPLKTRECCACNSYHKFNCVKESSIKRSRRSQKVIFPIPPTPEEEGLPQENVTKSSRRSRKRILPMPSPQGEGLIKDKESCIASENQGIVKQATPGKKFTLKPSRLVVTDVTNFDTIPMKTRASRRIKMRETNETSPEHDYVNGVDGERNSENEESSSRRRSTRKSSARKVTFNSSAKEKISLKLPVTPFKKSGGNKVAESPNMSD